MIYRFKTVVAFAVLLLAPLAQGLTRIASIGGIEASDLFTAPLDVTDPYSLWGPAFGPDLQKPQSHRTIYGCYTGPSVNNLGSFLSPILSDANGLSANVLPIQLVETPILADALLTLQVKLEHPYLEMDPYGCASGTTATSASAATGDCRCNIISTAYSVLADNGLFYQPVTFGALGAPLNYSTYVIPSSTYFEHAPFPGQNPFMRTYQKLCLLQNGAAYYTDSTIWIAVTKCCQSDSDCASDPTMRVAFTWNALPANTYGSVQLPIWGALNFAFTQLLNSTTYADGLPSDWKCNNRMYLGAYFQSRISSSPAVVATSYDGGDCWGETQEMTLARIKRVTCCGAHPSATSPYVRDWLGFLKASNKYGTCIDTSIDQCCGWKPFNTRFEQCCSRYHSRINNIEQSCKCTSESENFDCKQFGANTLGNTVSRGESDAQVTTRACCVNTKYPELVYSRWTNVDRTLITEMRIPRYGSCYDTTSTNFKCCDDGNIFDIGSQQCCVVNGVQSLNVPCPCSNDRQCNGLESSSLILSGQVAMNKVCCMQQWPRAWLDGQGPALGQCDKYSNWPDGTGAAELQRCAGNCMDVRFQTCCNGRICVKKYERCCNSTCCNRFTSGCMEGTRPGSRGFGSRANPNDYLVSYEICSSIENMTTRRAFWVWVMPAFWCIATAVSLAIVIVVARRATENSFPLTERCMVFFSFVLIGLGAPHFFSPTYKYGVTVVFVALFCMIGAVMQSRRFSLAVVLIMFGMVGYWIDPFNGNIYLALPGGMAPTNTGFPAGAVPTTTQIRVSNNPASPVGTSDSAPYAIYNYLFQSTPGYRYSSGIIDALSTLEPGRNRGDCTGFYDYFSFDPLVHDMERVYNPNKTTFGFCSRAWMTTLLIFSCVALAVILVLLALSIFSYAKKVVPKSYHDDTAYTLPLDTQMPNY